MKSFFEFMNLMEAGVAAMKFMYCPDCSKSPGYRAEKINPWSNRASRCKLCGAGLMEKGDIAEDLSAVLSREIEELQKDPETMKGMDISDDIHLKGMSPESVYVNYGVTAEEADRLLEKAGILLSKQNKLRRLSPPMPRD